MSERLSNRKETILQSIIDSFIQRPEPVGSETLLRYTRLGVSSATIRSEMSELERLEYITHPHTSAGRLPTDKGYRYYVDHLLARVEADYDVIRTRINALKGEIKNVDAFFSTVSNLISDVTSQVGVVVFPVLDDLNFRYANLIYLNDRKILVVWATMSGLIKEQIVNLSEGVTPEMLQRIANFMNQEFVGMPFNAIKEHIEKRIAELEASYFKLVTIADEIVKESIAAHQERKMWIDGVNKIIDEPEFHDRSAMRPILEVFSRKNDLAQILEYDQTKDGVITTIGHENVCQGFKQCAIVRKSFFINDALYGTFSVVGPRRMNYAKVFATVDMLSDMVSEIFKGDDYF
jgi:heat-inducible transcriptional repressor